MTSLSKYKRVKPRFARSINVERDEGSSAIDGYLPVGRSIEVLRRLGVALTRPEVEAAISVTGPYGSGKSSLALIVDAIFGPASQESTRTAEEIIGAAAPAILNMLQQAKREQGAEDSGFVRAVATAQREPIIATVLRALHHGATRFDSEGSNDQLTSTIREIEEAIERLGSGAMNRPTSRDIRNVVKRLSELAPVLLIIDEFGKNLEAFADAQSEADLFLLQDLAEWTRGSDGVRLVLITLQHMAFDEYSNQASIAQRREWAKIQGRFDDVPFVDSAMQTRALIASSFEAATSKLASIVRTWAKNQVVHLRHLGLNDLGADERQIELAWPLHPLSLAVLPELCERYGQNERTLFSFLAGHEPLSVAQFLNDTQFSPGDQLPSIYLDRLYDYFIESAANLVSISANATRWIEIDSRVRDATGISEGARRVLKAVGLLNLISAGGVLRASRELVEYASADGHEGTESQEAVLNRLQELEAAGLVTYRDFADEYRIWSGTDFNIRSAIELARRQTRLERPSQLVPQVLELRPVIAARHSYESGTLRAFSTGWTDLSTREVVALTSRDRYDGLILYCLDDGDPTSQLSRDTEGKPVIFVVAPSTKDFFAACVEVAAIDKVLADLRRTGGDRVAEGELEIRRVEAAAELRRRFHETFSGNDTTWIAKYSGPNSGWSDRRSETASSVTSEVADSWYPSAPRIRNDLINRHELSSQSAKARRILLEHLISSDAVENLGIQGFGPEMTMYLSVYLENGMHGPIGDDLWQVSPPNGSSPIAAVWAYLNGRLKSASTSRLRVSDLYEDLASPPFGVRAGVAPLLLVPALMLAGGEVAVYEHGTFRPNLSEDVLERLLKNPVNFELKYFDSRSGVRAILVEDLAAAIGNHVTSDRAPTVLTVVASLVRLTRSLPEYTLKTSNLSPDGSALRRALLAATEPDVLLFNEIPTAFSMDEFAPGAEKSKEEISRLASRVKEAVTEIRSAYPRLLDSINTSLMNLVEGDRETVQPLLRTLGRSVSGHVFEPRLQSLATALNADLPDHEDWIKYVAMAVVGKPPEGWTDGDHRRFTTEIVELGGALHRLAAMHVDLPNGKGGKNYFRQLLTRSDGTEVAFVVELTDEQREDIKRQTDKLIAKVSDALGIEGATLRKMMSVVLSDAPGSPDSTETPPT
jgi:hypothetical protein